MGRMGQMFQRGDRVMHVTRGHVGVIHAITQDVIIVKYEHASGVVSCGTWLPLELRLVPSPARGDARPTKKITSTIP